MIYFEEQSKWRTPVERQLKSAGRNILKKKKKKGKMFTFRYFEQSLPINIPRFYVKFA